MVEFWNNLLDGLMSEELHETDFERLRKYGLVLKRTIRMPYTLFFWNCAEVAQMLPKKY